MNQYNENPQYSLPDLSKCQTPPSDIQDAVHEAAEESGEWTLYTCILGRHVVDGGQSRTLHCVQNGEMIRHPQCRGLCLNMLYFYFKEN